MFKYKNIIPIILFVVLIILIAVGYFFSWPKYQEFIDRKKELEIKDEEIARKEDYLADLNVISERLSEYDDEVLKINSALPADPSIAALFNFFQKESSRNGLLMKEIDVAGLFVFQKSEAGAVIRKMPFSIKVSGSYSAFKDFLHTVYLNTRVIRVKSIDFSSSSGEENAEDLFDFNLSLETQAYNPLK